MSGRPSRIAVVVEDRCRPNKCGQECRRRCPVNAIGTSAWEISSSILIPSPHAFCFRGWLAGAWDKHLVIRRLHDYEQVWNLEDEEHDCLFCQQNLG